MAPCCSPATRAWRRRSSNGSRRRCDKIGRRRAEPGFSSAMRSDSIVFAIAGMCFGIILGWVIGTQQAAKRAATPVQLQQSAAPAPAAAPAGGDAGAAGTAPRQAPPLDEGKVQSLLTIIKSDPKNA